MSDARAKDLLDLGSRLFTNKNGLDSLCQEIALNFYPERASFTSNLSLSEDFGAHLMDSFPVLLRRELGNSMSATLRPRDQKWFAAATQEDSIDNDPDAAHYLEYLTDTMRRSMYDARTKFVRATKEADHDFISFGQAIISVEEAPSRSHLLYKAHHFRDCAWLENDIGEIDTLHRKDRMTARQMRQRFGDKALHPTVKKALEKEPGREFNIRVVVMPAEDYDYVEGGGKVKGKERKLPFVVVYIDADNQVMLKEGGLPTFIYAVPRWHTISGSVYAFSPATMTALPDSRMAQSLARILLEAGEKTVDPPMIATEEAVREVNLQAGALSWVDYDYDERLGAALRPINIEGDMRTGFAMRQDVREMLSKAFFIDKLALPEAGKAMTAYEIRTRLEEHVRNLLPLFEPMEHEYNMAILDRSFTMLRAMNRFDFQNMPDILSGADVTWSFKNPMQEASTRIMVEQFQEAIQIEQAATQVGVRATRIDFGMARDDAIRGSGGPAKWRRSDQVLEAEAEQQAMKEKVAAAMQEVQGAAQAASDVGAAAQSLQGAGVLPQPYPATAETGKPNVRPPAPKGGPAKPMLRQAA